MVVEPDAAYAAVEAGPLVVEHDDLAVGGVELDMGDPAQGHGLLVEEFPCGGVIDAEVAVELFLLDTAVDVVDGALVQAGAFGVGVVVQDAAVGHGDAEQASVRADVGECRHATVGDMVEYLYPAVQADLADVVVLYVVDDVALAVQAHAGLSEALSGGAVEIDVALEYPGPVVGQTGLFARLKVPDIDIGMASLGTYQVQAAVV